MLYVWYDSSVKDNRSYSLPQPYNLIGDGPENPEIRVIADELCLMIIGKKIINMEWDEKSKYNRIGDPKGYSKDRFPCLVENIFTKGKKIIFSVIDNDSKNFYFMFSLGMEGNFSFIKGKHSNLWFNLDDLNNTTYLKKTLFFDDSRHFGGIEFFDTKEALDKSLAKLGPDVLLYVLYLNGKNPDLPEAEHLTEENFLKIFRNKRCSKKEVCGFLLDQKRLSGPGNWIRAESLYKARIKPDRTLDSLGDEEIEQLRLSIFDVTYRSYLANGCKIRTYKTLTEKESIFKCDVYMQKTCPLGYPVVKQVFKDKRTIHWVPDYQR
jgi:formamidopyrimidine-DNA glycosylase